MATNDLKTAASAIPGAQPGAFLPTTEASVFACPADKSWIGTIFITNGTLEGGSPASATAFVSIVNAGGSAGVQRILAATLTAGQTVIYKVQLNAGDYISGKSGTASAVLLVPDGTFFAQSSGAAASGIQVDADSTPFRGSAGSATGGSIKIPASTSNRQLMGGMFVQELGATAGYASYSALTMSCTDGPMTRLASIDFNNGASIVGSAHIFGRANPTNGSTQALSATAAASGATMGIVGGARAYSGVGSVTGAVTTGPTGAATMSLGITSAVGHVPFFAGAFFAPPVGLTASGLRVCQWDGLTSGFTVPQWLALCDALGVGLLTATTLNSTQHAAVAVDLVPA